MNQPKTREYRNNKCSTLLPAVSTPGSPRPLCTVSGLAQSCWSCPSPSSPVWLALCPASPCPSRPCSGCCSHSPRPPSHRRHRLMRGEGIPTHRALCGRSTVPDRASRPTTQPNCHVPKTNTHGIIPRPTLKNQILTHVQNKNCRKMDNPHRLRWKKPTPAPL